MESSVQVSGFTDIVGLPLAGKYSDARKRFIDFTKEMKLDEVSSTTALVVRTVSGPQHQSNIKYLKEETSPSEIWISSDLIATEKRAIIAIPINFRGNYGRKPHIVTALYASIVSRLMAWWLAIYWRSKQLLDATWDLAKGLQWIPAAACARSLLETAASVHDEAASIASIWNEVKSDCSKNGLQYSQYEKLSVYLGKAVAAGKFDDRSPEVKQSFGGIERNSIMTPLGKLAKKTDFRLWDNYQLLCNIVHPSVGNMFIFLRNGVGHQTGTHQLLTFSSNTNKLNSNIAETGDKFAKPFETSIVNSSIFSVDAIREVLDDALKIIDDIALTSQSGQYSIVEYWRKIDHFDVKAPCLCRSGRTSSQCRHAWNTPAPKIRNKFDCLN